VGTPIFGVHGRHLPDIYRVSDGKQREIQAFVQMLERDKEHSFGLNPRWIGYIAPRLERLLKKSEF
jgi:hypothetical protein